MNNSSNWNGRAHRSLEEAFGPYARGPIQEKQDPMPQADRLVVAISVIGLVAVGVLALAGVI